MIGWKDDFKELADRVIFMSKQTTRKNFFKSLPKETYISRCLFSSADFFFDRFTVSVIDISFKFSFCVAFCDVISKSLLMVMMMMMSLSTTSVLYFMVLLSSVTDPQSQLLRKLLKLL